MEQNEFLMIALVALIISLIIIYYIIKAAVEAGTKKLSDNLELLLHTRFTEDEINAAQVRRQEIVAANENRLKLEGLERELKEGHISKEYYEKEKQKLTVE